MKNRIRGAVYTAMAALSSTPIAGYVVDPKDFSVTDWHGIKQNLLFAGITAAIAEARYWWKLIWNWAKPKPGEEAQP